jgi:hypothetical protein
VLFAHSWVIDLQFTIFFNMPLACVSFAFSFNVRWPIMQLMYGEQESSSRE